MCFFLKISTLIKTTKKQKLEVSFSLNKSYAIVMTMTCRLDIEPDVEIHVGLGI